MRALFLRLLSFCIFIFSSQAQAYDDAQAQAIVLQGTPKDVYKLVKSGYDVNRVYKCQTLLNTAIKSAAENLAVNEHPENALKKIRILLNGGADYNQLPCKGQSLRPIFWAAALPLILQQTENELNDILDANIKQGTEYCDLPKLFSKACKEITPEEREQARRYFHKMTLHSIARLDPYFTEIVKLLLRRGVDLRKTDERGQTVLHYAASMPSEITTEPLALLLKKGIAVDTQNYDQRTPLFFAYGAHNEAAVKLLLDAGADPTMRDMYGILPNKTKSVTLDRTARQDGSISIYLKN